MAKRTKQTSLDKIKTGRWQRQWSVAKAGMSVSTGAATQMLGNAFLSRHDRQLQNKKILSEQSLYLAQELGKLKGSIVKVGQLMALYGEHVLPEEVTDALRTLEEQTIALSWEAIAPVIAQRLGEGIDDFDIEVEPIGAASLAQVHKALHKPSGEVLCLKVQYPGVAAAIDADINSLVTLLKMTRMIQATHTFNDWVEEIRQLLHLEVDYRREAELTLKFQQRLICHDIFVVPTIYPEYCSDQLLVNSYERGLVVTAPEVAALSQQRRNRLAKAFLQLFIDEVFSWGELQTDPNFGNYRIQIDTTEAEQDRIVLLDFGAVLSYDDSFLSPLKAMLLGAYHDDEARIRDGAIALGMMQANYPEQVHNDFADLCRLLIEPFVHQSRAEIPREAINDHGEYCWATSRLPKRAAKHAASSALSKYFAVPPQEFAFLSRKLLGVYSFISALEAEFNPDGMLDLY